MNQVKDLQAHGESIEIPNFEAMLNPHPHYAALAAKGPVVRLRTHLGVEVYGITRWDTAIAVLRDSRFSKSSATCRARSRRADSPGPARVSRFPGPKQAIY